VRPKKTDMRRNWTISISAGHPRTEWHQHRRSKGADADDVFSAPWAEIDPVLTFRNWLRVVRSANWPKALEKRTQDYTDAKTSVIAMITARASAIRRSEL
jgi:hypothetical protein